MEWKTLEMGLSRRTTIDVAAQNVVRSEEKKWRQLLERIVHIIQHLAGQNLALRGHCEDIRDDSVQNKGNFLAQVRFLSRYDPALREHFTKLKLGKENVISYLSPLIQNQIVVLLGNQVRRRIIEQVK